MKNFIKEIIFALLLSIILIFILSIAISQTSMSEKVIMPITIGIATFSILLSAFRLSKTKKEKGILYGGALGIVYMLIIYLISSFANFNFSLNLSSIIMILLGIIGGAVGEILGVNF